MAEVRVVDGANAALLSCALLMGCLRALIVRRRVGAALAMVAVVVACWALVLAVWVALP